MTIEELAKQPPVWLSREPPVGIIVSSRVRIARNLRDAAFPNWAGEDECEKVCERLISHIQQCHGLLDASVFKVAELSPHQKQILFERHLISRDFFERGKGSALVLARDQRLAVMINEEDHLRMHALRPGLDVRGAWEAVNQLDSELAERVDFAFTPQLGFLTACPSNVGTGLRASVMLHLPGLVLQKQIEPVIRGCAKIGLAVRGLWGEGTEAVGNMFQISNQFTLGASEDWIISQIERIVQEIVEHEENARAQLVEKKIGMLKDVAGRAYGVLRYAHSLSSREALDLLSALRLGLDLGIIKTENRSRVDELLLWVQPAHLQELQGKTLKATRERDAVRAARVREALREAGVHPVENKQSK